MRVVGHRSEPSVTEALNADGWRALDQLNVTLGRLSGAVSTHVPKGVYRYKTHADANRHQDECLARGMAHLALRRRTEETPGYAA